MSQADFEARLTELEVRLAFIDETVNALQTVETEQAQRVLALEQALRDLRQELVALRLGQAHDPHSEPPPPHY
ncbi:MULTISPECIES: SlyX family protein [Dyella]|uniref:SlyX family protein n=2 Tax=Dyella TaxID=231454 RepID=A0A4R0YTN5_9GAMM|nr:MULTISPECIES: SlyX family protein [Dyella]TBR39673.1 SlyX family protein [Dyella terrae]TCI12745.1 SlyX family protein [Dyella soli]